MKLWKYLAFYLTLLLNLFIFASFAKKDGLNEDGDEYDRMEDIHFFQQKSWSVARTKRLF